MSDTIRLTTALSGRYRIERELGAERFLAEIKTTANLQHPHILPLHDSGEVNGTVFYVMPFVEGESLRDRLQREKQLPVPEAVRIASEVAGALDYAHRHGVIHRDIKPENILLHDGQALVADFGIALAASRSEGSDRLTETGMSLGTPQYMSPEQATGERDLDGRTDVYALGCVLYEMLAGVPPFTGPTAQAILAQVLSSEPAPVTKLRRSVPAGIATATHAAIEKLPADRFESARAFLEALAHPDTTATIPGVRRTRGLPTLAPRLAWTLIITLAALAIGAAALALNGRGAVRAGHTTRFAIALPAGEELMAPGGSRVAFAPDGRSFVYPGPGEGRPRLWLRRLDRLEATPIMGSEGATSPTFSPDGKSIAFATLTAFSLQVIPVAGGQPRVLAIDGVSGGGVAWSSDGYLYFDGVTGLARIRPDGSDRSMVLPLDTLHGESGVGWPEALPDGRGILVRVRRGGEPMSDYRLVVLDLHDGTRKELTRAVTGHYAPSGHLLFVTADGSLYAQPFDLARLQLRGSPTLLWSGVALGGFGATDLTLSSTGDLLYSAGAIRTSTSALVWVGRDGSKTAVDSAPEDGLIRNVTLSPDGSAIAMAILRTTSETSNLDRIYVKHLNGGPTQLVTTELQGARYPVWSPDGRDILYMTTGGASVLRRRADGSGDAIPLFRTRLGMSMFALAPDGKTLVMEAEATPSSLDLMTFRIGVDTVPVPLLSTPGVDHTPRVSPDGRWLAYASDQSGRYEVYVRPYPDGNVQVSVDGGQAPLWNRAGGELFYVSGNGDLVAATVKTTPAFVVTGRQRLFSSSGFQGVGGAALYDVAPDGKRFLMLDISIGGNAQGQLVMVQDFAAELARILSP